MKKIITLIAILVFGIQLSQATPALPLNLLVDIDASILLSENNDSTDEGRIYYWKVENAHSSASGYVLTLEKAESMIKKVSKGDYNRTIIVMSNPN